MDGGENPHDDENDYILSVIDEIYSELNVGGEEEEEFEGAVGGSFAPPSRSSFSDVVPSSYPPSDIFSHDPSLPPSNVRPPESLVQQRMSEDPPERLDIDEAENDLFTVRFLRTFKNNRFNLTGNLYQAITQSTPESRRQGRLLAFENLMSELDRIINSTMKETDYVQLIFNSTQLDRPIVIPVSQVSLFDKRVAELQFSNIITSNMMVDCQNGDFTISIYHISPPTGGGKKLKEFGLNMEIFLKKKKDASSPSLEMSIPIV